MEYPLTERQIRLLEAIIKEYSESCAPVGSKSVVKKYSLKVSPATIRNEMASLLEDGFLEMRHTSSGRVPTSRAFRFFIEELMEEEDLPVLQEIAIKQRLWPQRYEFEKMLRQAVKSLSDATNHMSLAITGDGFVTHGGFARILDNNEFWDIEVAKTALEIVDKYEVLDEMFRDLVVDGDVNVAVGDEIGLPNMDYCSLVFTPFKSRSKNGFIAVLGPSRMRYSTVVPSVRYAKNLIEEFGSSI